MKPISMFIIKLVYITNTNDPKLLCSQIINCTVFYNGKIFAFLLFIGN